jgi:hypothetical protein
MKKLILILILILFAGIKTSIGQVSVSTKPWSVSVSYSPKFEIPRGISPAQEKYYLSFDLSFDRKIFDHFSMSSGLRFHTLDRTGIAIGSHIPPFNYMESYTFLEFPIQINYHPLKNPHRINPLILTSLINSYYHSVFEVELTDDNYSDINDKYFIFWDIGVGSIVNISNNFSMIGQVSAGLGLKYYNPQYTYYKTSIGIRYTFLKKVNS